MILPVVFLVAASATAPLTAPPLPPMVAPEFQAQVMSVQRALEKGDFPKAAKLASVLPKMNFAVQWDERKVDGSSRVKFQEARNQAIAQWRDAIPGIPNPKIGPTGDIKFSFEPNLAHDPETGAPASVVMFFGNTAPALESVIGIKRGAPTVYAQPDDVFNDVSMSLGTYFGVAKDVAPGSPMSLSIPGQPGRHGMTFPVRVAARQNMKVVAFLRKAIEEKKRVRAVQADVFMDPDRFEGEAVQGLRMDVSVQLTNRGDGVMSYRVEGDCGCIVANPPGTIAPRSSALVEVTLDTREFTTVTTRRLRVYTNDPKEPVREIPVSLNVVPRYRFLVPGGTARDITENGGKFDVFLAFAEGRGFSVDKATLSGIEGKVETEPWEGELPDPERGEPARKRKGYRFRIQIPKTQTPGRALVGLNLATDSLDYPTLSHQLTVQNGVAAAPNELFLGEIAKIPKRSFVIVNKPGAALKILSATTDARSLKVTVLPGRDPSEKKLQIDYDGSAPTGDFSATVILRFDDPKQPELLIPIMAVVR